jgi:hypothetical protein
MAPAIYPLSTGPETPVLRLGYERAIGAGHHWIYLGSSQKPWV